MSLELAIQENTDTMKQLIAVWNTLTNNATMAATRQPGDTITAGGVPIAKVAAPKPVVAADTAKTQPNTAAAAGQSADPKSAAVSQPQETAAAQPASKPEASKSAPAVTYDDVKALVLQVSKDKGRDAAAAVLAGFGVAKAPELKPEQYADAVAQFRATLV